MTLPQKAARTLPKAFDRRAFIGGSDARIIMGSDEAAQLRLRREKRGEVEPEDLSDNLIVQLGTVTEQPVVAGERAQVGANDIPHGRPLDRQLRAIESRSRNQFIIRSEAQVCEERADKTSDQWVKTAISRMRRTMAALRGGSRTAGLKSNWPFLAGGLQSIGELI